MQLSKNTLAVMLVLAVIGTAFGINTYAMRSGNIEVNDPAANAIALHIVLAAVTAVVIAAVSIHAKKAGRPSPFRAPFTEQAFARTKATLLFRNGFGLLNILRFLATLFLLYILLWEPFRAAAQPIAALDPNFRVNAWGGPSYLGATLAHWLDGFMLFYAAAFMLQFVLLKPFEATKKIRTKASHAKTS